MEVIVIPDEIINAENSNAVVFKEAEVSELMFKEVGSEQEAFDLYNDYAFKMGFSIRRSNVQTIYNTNIWRSRKYVCSNAGLKDDSKKDVRRYERLDFRTNCGAFVEFIIERGVWIVVQHLMDHNHPMIPIDKRHLLRSQRKVNKEHLKVISVMKASGVRVSDSLHVISKEVGGSPNLGCTKKDVYNALDVEKSNRLDGSDCNQLIKYFAQRQAKETDFYYEFEVDKANSLTCVFWRDGRMKRDYEFFGDLMVFDTTYRTNKYGMICAPFIGMNHHCNNVMFGMGFVLDEKAGSFIWLFESFMRSMGGGRHPITIMTDQAPSIAAAIRAVFPSSRHRLCTWHLGENSKTNIGKFRAMKGFTDLFDFLTKYCETAAEFEHYWPRMMDKYDCHDSAWLNHLYSIKERWCPAYSKEYFSARVLSSQRSETTNRSVSHRLRKTDGMCDFYKTFLDVVAEWRSRESKQDFRFLRGNRHLAVANVSLLIHAREVYTISVYIVFEDQFAKAISCCQERKSENDETITYLVWRPNKDIIRHEVILNKFTRVIKCTCKYWSEMGLLCSHSLRIYNIHCVQKIPEEYIVKRWTKTAMCSHVVDEETIDENVVASSVWRAQMTRKFVQLVTSCQDYVEASAEIEYTFDILREKVERVRGPILFDDGEEEVEEVSKEGEPIQNPKIKRKKGERNDRPKSTVEKAYNKSKGWKKKVDKYKDEVKATTEKFFQVLDDDGDPMIYSHPTEPGSNLNVLPKQKNFQPSTKGISRSPARGNTNKSKNNAQPTCAPAGGNFNKSTHASQPSSSNGVDGPPRTEKSNKSNYTAQSSCVPPKNSSNPSSSNVSSQLGSQAKKRKHPEVNSNRSFQYEKSKWYQYFDAGRNARNEGSSNASASSNVSHYDEMLSMFDKTS